MREFGSMAAFAEHLGTVIVAEIGAEHSALERAAQLLEKAVKAKFGEYQPQAGEFVAWAELADATKADREKQGFAENEPLLRTGELRDSVGHKVGSHEAAIGSNSDIAVWQELGTARIPPRSFFGSAAVENSDKIKKIVGEMVVVALVGKEVFGGAIDI